MQAAYEILTVLDRAADAYALPALDNGYIYLAATRMALFRSSSDWAMVFEVFGYSPRAGVPDLSVSTFGSRLRDRDPPDRYATPEAYKNYLRQHPNDEIRFFHPMEAGAWLDEDACELVADRAVDVVLRGNVMRLPSADDLRRQEIEPSDAPRLRVCEVCRYFAGTVRDHVLATDAERRVSVPTDLDELLRLEDWHHPDLVASERPSENESFRQLARVLATGDIRHYQPTARPNTHWRNWPLGGTL